MRVGSITLMLIGVVAGGVACASALKHPDAKALSWATTNWPNVELADLHHGRSLYVRRCSSCHSLYLPNEYAPERWAELTDDMVEKAELTSSERDLIVYFLASMSASGI